MSKTKPVEQIFELCGFGQCWFGENYAEELFTKSQTLAEQHPQAKFSFIGTLQSNKIQKLVQHCDEIQTVTSVKHLRYISRYADQEKKTPFPVFIQCNFWQETSKSGVSYEEAQRIAKVCKEEFSETVALKGLMGIPPARVSEKQDARPYQEFILAAKTIGDGQSSIGMSKDWKTAAKAGSSCIRIGSLLFGARD